MEKCANCNNEIDPEEICQYCGHANTDNNSRAYTLKSWLCENMTLAPSNTLYRKVDVQNVDEIISAVVSATNKNNTNKENHDITFRLATLKELFENKLITEEEYNNKKDLLLSRLTD